MPKQSVPFYALNRGEVSRLALARVDVDKLRLAAEQQINLQPLAIGAATLRPGSAYLGSTDGNNPAKLLEFIYATDDAALIELTNAKMRVWVNDALVTRVAVTSTIQGLASWTATVSPTATVTLGPPLIISGVTQGNISSARGTITCGGANIGKEHALRIVVAKGPIIFKIGSAVDGEDVVDQTSLEEGTHSICFTPAVGTLYAQFESQDEWSHQVTSIALEAAGVFTLPTPWLSADLSTVTYDQSGDVIFVAHRGYQQMRLERRSTNGWSIVKYKTYDGPFPAAEGDETIKITPSDLSGDTTLTANKPVFTPAHVGCLVRLFHTTQTSVTKLNAANTFTKPVRVSGLSISGAATNERDISTTIAGTWATTLTLQRTFDPEGLSDWVSFRTFTINHGATVLNDSLDNTIIHYRLGFEDGLTVTGHGAGPAKYVSGTAECTITTSGGGWAGIARITGYTSSTVVSAEVLSPFANVAPSENWRFSEWNGDSGWPSSVALHEGRLWWAGNSKIWGSVSDGYSSFDFEKTGDAAPIQRSVGSGPIANINWLLSLGRLALGADSGVIAARSNSIDEPLTPTVFNLKYSSTQGASFLRPIKIDTKGMYVERSGRRVYGLIYSTQAFDYKVADMTRLNLDIGIPGFVDVAVQRQSDTHVRFARGDGMMACLLYDEDDDVAAWWRVQTDGVIENVAVLPGTLEDRVYVVVNRTIGGVTKRYIEKFARLDECKGGTVSKLADSHIVYSGAPAAVIPGLAHLEGKSVVVWGDGKEVGFSTADPKTITTYTVTGGQITLPLAVSNAVVGLPYTGTFVSAKLAYAAANGTAVNVQKRVGHIGMVLDTTHYQAIRHGSWSEDSGPVGVRSMPLIEKGKPTPIDTIWTSYDQEMFPFSGEWNTDSRLYIEARAPRPATICGLTIEMETSG